MTYTAEPMRSDASADHNSDGRVCRHCSAPFKPRKPWQIFCQKPCRNAYHESQGDGGMRAKVSGARLLKGGGVSVTLRFAAADKDAAMLLEPGRTVELSIVESQK
jgi:hypothetical protein